MSAQPTNTKENNWTIISCQCSSSEEEICSWLFFEYGALGVESKALDKKTISLTASFTAGNPKTKRITSLRKQFEKVGLHKPAQTVKKNSLANQNWLSNWKKHFEPFHIGDAFLIYPPWTSKKIKDKDIIGLTKLIIDPGMAFGTGLHTTTSFCLRAIKEYLQGPNILDVGTGSGILSIASSLLLPKAKITAIDIDENATENAEHNIALNDATGKIKLRQESLESFAKSNKTQFNTILSNMTAEAIIDFLPIYKKILAPGGILILAGIIEERLNLLETTISKYPFKLMSKEIEKGWAGLVLIKT